MDFLLLILHEFDKFLRNYAIFKYRIAKEILYQCLLALMFVILTLFLTQNIWTLIYYGNIHNIILFTNKIYHEVIV